MRTFVATKNAGKLAEMRAVFANSPLELDVYPQYVDVDETADDYVGNARLKAQALYAQLQEAGIEAAVLADDSGLEVDALDGRPGIFSARYAGKEATWEQRRQKLLGELADTPDPREAQFISAMVLVLPTNEEVTALGKLSGVITHREYGNNGFGYDPVFIPERDTRTFAEFSCDEKNRVSHRHNAACSLLEKLDALST